jgi:hypothetical protein
MKRGTWPLVAALALATASLACGTEQSATAINPPTLTPLVTVAHVPTPTTFVPTSQPASALSASDLRVNGNATIHTTAGDKLRIHSRPSFDAPVVFKLESGTLVTIIAGPQVVDADRWWQIETADGQRGWAVESAEGIQTLIPSP